MTKTSPVRTLTESHPPMAVRGPAGVRDEEAVPGGGLDGAPPREGGRRAGGVLDPVRPRRAGLAAGRAEGGPRAMAGRGGDVHGDQDPQPPDPAVTAGPAAAAAA